MDHNINFYEVIPQEYLKPIATYANFKDIQIPLPVRIALCGSAGTGKTLAVMNTINHFNCFERFYLFVGDAQESLYKFLVDYVRQEYGKKAITVCHNLDEVPLIADFDPTKNNLVIIDDLINEKNNNQVNALNLFTNGRRQNISIIYVSQDYFKINKTVRRNCTVTIMTRFDDQRDLQRILASVKQGYTAEEIRSLYDYATHGGLENFFTIDNQAKPGWRYRRNLAPIDS